MLWCALQHFTGLRSNFIEQFKILKEAREQFLNAFANKNRKKAEDRAYCLPSLSGKSRWYNTWQMSQQK